MPNMISGGFLRQMLGRFDELDSSFARAYSEGCLDKDVLPLCATATRGIGDYSTGTTHWLALYHQRIMATQSILEQSIRYIIDTTCPAVVHAVLQAGDGGDVGSGDWLYTLTAKVAFFVKVGMPVKAKSTEFFPSTILAPKVFHEVEGKRRRKTVPPRKVEPTTLSYMRRILFLWFCTGTPFTSQIQASFVRGLVSHLGLGALLLPQVWEVYSNFPDWLLSKECPLLSRADTSPDNTFKPEYLSAFFDRLRLDQRTPALQTALQQLQHTYLQLHQRTHTHFQGTVQDGMKAANLRKLMKAMSTAITNQMPTAAGDGDNAGDTDNEELPSTPTPMMTRSTRRVLKFLEDSLAVANAMRGPEDSHISLNEAQTFILQKPDYYLPLRELAPGRATMRTHLSTWFAQTRAGFFSLQVFRFIHFNTEAFRQCPPHLRQVAFHSLAEYEQYLEDLRHHFPGRNESFFCDPKSLGNPIAGRTTERASDYWEVAMAASFPWPPARQFAAAHNGVRLFKRSLPASEKHLWAGVGDLSMFMLVLDMHFAGLIDAPTLDDITDVVSTLQKGASFGLRDLGYVNATPTRAEIAAAFQQFFYDIDTILTDEQQSAIGWSPVVAEHTLCKFSRMYGEAFYV